MKKEVYKMTKEEMLQIDEIFVQHKDDDDRLMKELAKYAYPDGSWSLYIRWALDALTMSKSLQAKNKILLAK